MGIMSSVCFTEVATWTETSYAGVRIAAVLGGQVLTGCGVGCANCDGRWVAGAGEALHDTWNKPSRPLEDETL